MNLMIRRRHGRMARRTRRSMRKSQAFSFLLAVLPFAAHGQPAAPAGLKATPGDGSVTLAWSNPADSTITGYSYSYATSASALEGALWNPIAGSDAATTTHAVSGLANGTRYHFRLRAINTGDDGPATGTTSWLAATPGAAVAIGDTALRGAVERALGRSAGAAITQLDMAQLTTLTAHDSGVAGLVGMEQAVNLRRLYLSGNAIADISALGALTSLTRLHLHDNVITDISALGALTSLTHLYLHDNFITDVAALGALASLTEIWLHNNAVTDVSALGALTSLTRLYLHNNAVTDISALGALTSLTRLYLYGNAITDVSALGALTALRWLSLRDNAITDVSALGALKSLTRLYLNDNAITDVSALGALTSQEYLSLKGNPLDAGSLCDHIPALRTRDVRVLFGAGFVTCGPLSMPDLAVAGSGYELRHARADVKLDDWTAVAAEPAAPLALARIAAGRKNTGSRVPRASR